jgi:putative hemolysin
MNYLKHHNHLHTKINTFPVSGSECYPDNLQIQYVDKIDMPSLMEMYLRYGAKVCGPPAIDRAFKTIDFFVLLDIDELTRETLNMFTS